jgi:SAM-dependent methyltransferase
MSSGVTVAPETQVRRPRASPPRLLGAPETLRRERGDFYTGALRELMARGILDAGMRVLAVAAGATDRDVFRGLGFEDVTLTNIEDRPPLAVCEPYRWEHQDAESLTFPDEAFDWAVVSAGLHHCSSPHRALLELYRVAQRGVLAVEARDCALTRLAVRLGVVDAYELPAVAANGFRAGGVRDTSIPNFVYRWTEREVEKTIMCAAPHARHEFVWFHELELPLSIFDVGGNGRWRKRLLLRALAPGARGLTRLLPSQANLFGFAIVKPQLPRDLNPWLTLTAKGPRPDEAWIRRRLGG